VYADILLFAKFWMYGCCQLPTPGPPRKRKKLGELGCEGAYFMPTETRSVAVDRLTKASVVEMHVSSLRPVGSENAGSVGKLAYLFMLILI